MVFRRYIAIAVHNQQCPVPLMQDVLEPKALAYPCAFYSSQTCNALLSTFPISHDWSHMPPLDIKWL